MKKDFKLDVNDNIPLIRDGKSYIMLNPSISFTFSETGKFVFLGSKYYEFNSSSMALARHQYSPFITAVLGEDALSKYYYEIDMKNKKCIITDKDLYSTWSSLKLTKIYPYYLIDLTIDGKPSKVVLDLGNKVSYIKDSYAEGKELVSTGLDYNEGVNSVPDYRFTTKLYNFSVGMGSESFESLFSVLPTSLLKSKIFNFADAVIGYDILKSYVVVLDIEEMKIYYKKN